MKLVFDSFMNKEVTKNLKAIENERILYWLKIFIMFSISGFLISGYFFILPGLTNYLLLRNAEYTRTNLDYVLLYIFLTAGFSIFYWLYTEQVFKYFRNQYNKLNSSYKGYIINEYMKYFNKSKNCSLEYSYGSNWRDLDFIESNLFAEYNINYKCSDFIEGATDIEGVHIKISDVSVSKGMYIALNRKIFKGLFGVANYNKDINYFTIIMDKKRKSFLSNKYKVNLEDVEFNKLFNVYSVDQQEARYILSTSIMEKIKEYKSKINRDISISFINDKVYFAFAQKKDLFEIDIYRNMTNISSIRKDFEAFELMLDITKYLKLENKIYKSPEINLADFYNRDYYTNDMNIFRLELLFIVFMGNFLLMSDKVFGWMNNRTQFLITVDIIIIIISEILIRIDRRNNIKKLVRKKLD